MKEDIKIEIPQVTSTRTIIQQKGKVVDINRKRYNRSQENKEWKKNVKEDY